MEDIKCRRIVELNDKKLIAIDVDTAEILQYINEDSTIIYFTDNIINNENIFQISEIQYIKKMIIVSPKLRNKSNKNIIITSKIKSYNIKKATNNIIIIINLNNDYKYSKLIIKNIEKLIKFSNKYSKNIEYKVRNSKVIASIYNNNSVYCLDIINALKVIELPSIKEKYEFIYDTVCQYLDNKFHTCNFCDFKNDTCILNRKGHPSGHKTMGCCYSFDYSGPFELTWVKNVKLCKYLKNKSCTTKNISCKLFTCKILKKNNIYFNTHKILLLDCFFNLKQHEIIRSNFFRTKEEILQKLLEKNYDPYLWYYMFRRYAIKNKE